MPGSQVPIAFPLSSGGTSEAEILWARALETPRQFEIESIPFRATGISRGDVVYAPAPAPAPASGSGADRVYEGTLSFGEHSTVRVDLLGEHDGLALREELSPASCEFECREQVVAIDVPPDINLAWVRGRLDEGVSLGHWVFEELADGRTTANL